MARLLNVDNTELLLRTLLVVLLPLLALHAPANSLVMSISLLAPYVVPMTRWRGS